MRLYQGQTVWLLWQSKQACSARARGSGESHWISCTTGGLVWFRPYGTSWMRPNTTIPATTRIRMIFLAMS